MAVDQAVAVHEAADILIVGFVVLTEDHDWQGMSPTAWRITHAIVVRPVGEDTVSWPEDLRHGLGVAVHVVVDDGCSFSANVHSLPLERGVQS